MSNLQCKLKNTMSCKHIDNQTLEICRDCIYLITEKVILAQKPIKFDKTVKLLKDMAEEKQLEGLYDKLSIDKNAEQLLKNKLDQIKDPTKAARFNEGKPQWSYVHFKSLEPMVRVLEFGAIKYAPKNWMKPMDTTKILESMQRHLAALFDGEECDPETGLSHMGHIQCNALFYNYHKEREKNDNNRSTE
jgi:hypothetical protein